MAFQRPTLAAIIARVEGDIKGALSINTILRRSFLGAMSRAIAGAAHILHGHMVFISKQIFPDQAEDEFLDRWGSIYGLERTAATFSQQTIDVVFTGAGTVPAGTIYQRLDATEYTVDTDIDGIAAGAVSGTITASVAGISANNDVGAVVSLQSAIANVEGDATVTATVTEGEDAETDESYRQRIVDRIQKPPAGGTVNDYIQFARSVAGVTRAWVFPSWMGEGTVGVSFVEDGENPIIPTGAKVTEVQTAVDLAKPVTALAVVFAPTDNPVNMSIAIKPNTLVVRNAVTAELTDLFQNENEVRGGFAGIGLTFDGKIALSRVNESISLAAGEQDHNLITPTSDPIPGNNGGILTLGTLTFSTLA